MPVFAKAPIEASTGNAKKDEHASGGRYYYTSSDAWDMQALVRMVTP